MSDLIVQDKGYTVIYDTSDGNIGFIGIDDHSGGYPFFSGWFEKRHVYADLAPAKRLLETGLKMGTYYGADKVHFGTMRVVKMSTVFQEVTEDLDQILYNEAISKLTETDLEIIKRHIKEDKS